MIDKTIKALQAARRGELTTVGTPEKLLISLDDQPRVKTPEDWLTAVPMHMGLDHCARPAGTLDSYTGQANADAMRPLAEARFIRIDDGTGDRIRATVLPKADAFLRR